MQAADALAQLIIYGLATYRLALMIAKEDGPFWMFKALRRKIKGAAPEGTHLEEGIECLWCVSMQMALLMALCARYLGSYALFQIIAFSLALSGFAVICNQIFTKGKAK
jgi:hypothetical protein